MTHLALRIHLTNVTGTGATQLLLSLLPAFERSGAEITEIHLPDRGVLADYKPTRSDGQSKRYRRWLPNALSRLLECLVFARRFGGDVPLLVLGDLPLRCSAPQTVFVQTPHLVRPKNFRWNLDGIKFEVARFIFRTNSRFASAFIVQTGRMRDTLAASYPEIADRIHVIAQPVPVWLLEAVNRREFVRTTPQEKLRLIYPAAYYPHKNHRFLARIPRELALSLPVERLVLTVEPERVSFGDVPWIKCVGLLNVSEMVNAYQEADAVLFLSTDESYGFPLVEAMFVGLPIVCPDLPYARALCSSGAIYYDPDSVDSLSNAIKLLHSRLRSGWSPDWSVQLASIPKDWDTVAGAMINLACHTYHSQSAT